MRRLILAVLLASPAFAAITAGTAVSDVVGSNTTVTATYTITAGNLVVAQAFFTPPGTGCGTATLTVTTNGGNTLTQISTLHGLGADGTNDYTCSGYFYQENAASATSITATSDAARTNLTIQAVQFSGAATSSSLDFAGARVFDSSSPLTSASFSTTNANDVIIYFTAGYYSNTWTGGSASIGGSAATVATSTVHGVIAYRIVSATQSSITGEIAADTPLYNNVAIASFKESGGAPPAAARRRIIN